MFLFHPIHFLKFLIKSQPQRSYNKSPLRGHVVTDISREIMLTVKLRKS